MTHKNLETFKFKRYIYLTSIGDFITVLHKDLLSNNLSHKKSFRVLTSNILITDCTIDFRLKMSDITFPMSMYKYMEE